MFGKFYKPNEVNTDCPENDFFSHRFKKYRLKHGIKSTLTIVHLASPSVRSGVILVTWKIRKLEKLANHYR